MASKTFPANHGNPMTADDTTAHALWGQSDDTSRYASDQVVMESLRSVRSLLDMEVAFVSEFQNGHRVFRYIDSGRPDIPLAVGASNPLEESYCQRVVDGRLPQVIQNACEVDEALTLPVTRALPVGAHVSVPIRFSDGHVYGTYCCFSTYPDYKLGDRDLRTMRLFADMVGKVIEHQVAVEHARDQVVSRVRAALDGDGFTSVYQPIFNVSEEAEEAAVGYEALTRFLVEPVRTPDAWFVEAADVDLQEELELAAIRKALTGFEQLPDGTYVSLNASPATILKGSIAGLLADYPPDRLMLEITEHVSINDYAIIAAALEPLRRQGMKLAVDDAGSGYASFRHVLKLKPDVIKLDISLIQKIDSDPCSRALAAALVRFAEETGSHVVAEGVETFAELDVLRALKVDKAQGFLLGRPMPVSQLRSEPPRYPPD